MLVAAFAAGPGCGSHWAEAEAERCDLAGAGSSALATAHRPAFPACDVAVRRTLSRDSAATLTMDSPLPVANHKLISQLSSLRVARSGSPLDGRPLTLSSGGHDHRLNGLLRRSTEFFANG